MDVFKMPVHPSAKTFPMLAKDELQELANSIKEQGLNHPIVVKNNVLIDGRNRLAACKLAGVKPTTAELGDQDIDSFIIAENINRRHMTKGQKAMAVAMIYPDAINTGRAGSKERLKKSTVNLDKAYISQARTVLRSAGDLSENVLSGSLSLNDAYKTALLRKQAAEHGDEAMAALRDKHPELADRVNDGDIDLDEALTLSRQKEINERANRAATSQFIKQFLSSGQSISRNTKHSIPLFKGHKDEIEKCLDMSIEDAIKQIKEIKPDVLINLLESVE